MLYHIFNVRFNNGWHKTPAVYTDSEFETLMDKVNWKLPFNISVYHFESDTPEKCNNTIMKAMPIIDISIEDLFLKNVNCRMKLADKIRMHTAVIHNKVGQFVVADTEDQYNTVILVDGENYKIITDFKVIPLSFKKAKSFVNAYHRHNVAPQGHKFSIGLTVEDQLIGVVIASEPKARALNDGYTLEINRCCVNSIYSNACSKMYSLAVQSGKAMGYKRFVTYTLPEESGSSIKAAGFHLDGYTCETPNGWSTKSRLRKIPERYPTCKKLRWVL